MLGADSSCSSASSLGEALSSAAGTVSAAVDVWLARAFTESLLSVAEVSAAGDVWLARAFTESLLSVAEVSAEGDVWLARAFTESLLSMAEVSAAGDVWLARAFTESLLSVAEAVTAQRASDGTTYCTCQRMTSEALGQYRLPGTARLQGA